MNSRLKEALSSKIVWIAGLGYFVDMFDLSLFAAIRGPALRGIGVAESDMLTVGAALMNWQMAGMIVGGFLWGILGDRRGRVTVLFGSILVYSVANLLNAFVETPLQFSILRFICGLGLAGELGAAITLVAESLSKEARGYGTTVVATLGLLGSALSGLLAQFFHWQTAFMVGGVMGLVLLFTRFKGMESGLFLNHSSQSHVKRGDFFLIFRDRTRVARYVACILVAVPIYFMTGILVTFSPEISVALGVAEPVGAAAAIFSVSMGLALGDLLSGLVSQWLKSRKAAIAIFIGLILVSIILLRVVGSEMSALQIYWLCFLMGIGGGYWAVFVTTAAEQFGTNLRATVTTTAPNLVRGSSILMNLSWIYFKDSLGVLGSAMLVGAVVFLLAAVSWGVLKETYGRDLDFQEL